MSQKDEDAIPATTVDEQPMLDLGEDAEEAPKKRAIRRGPRKKVVRKKVNEEATKEHSESEVPEHFSTDGGEDEPQVKMAEEHESRDSEEKRPPRRNSRGDRHQGDRHQGDRHQGDRHQGGHQRRHSNANKHQHQGKQKQNFNKQQRQHNKKPQQQANRRPRPRHMGDPHSDLNTGGLPNWDIWNTPDGLNEYLEKVSLDAEPFNLSEVYTLGLPQLTEMASDLGVEFEGSPQRVKLLTEMMQFAYDAGRPVVVEGIVDVMDGDAVLVYETDNYRRRSLSAYMSKQMVKHLGLFRGHQVKAVVHPPRERESCPFVMKVLEVMGGDPEAITQVVPFNDLVPYYPTERLFLETQPDVEWDNISMRVVDLLTPLGLGQRGLIVAPPRTGKTVLLQGIAKAVAMNRPEAHLMVLLVDERPEEVTDFKRQVQGEVISSTFDETPESHVHAAEMVISKARRMVEMGKDVVIVLDSITRLARAYNTMMPNSGKILSGGVEANALQKPKRFFGSARNIEGGGSLTILGSALVDTGSRMDEVIFEEFKGTGNMELHLDRGLVDKRIFPAISFEKSGTRKEELLYHPTELEKIYSLRRAMKGVPSLEAMEMLIQRVRKTKTNAEFLMAMNR